MYFCNILNISITAEITKKLGNPKQPTNPFLEMIKFLLERIAPVHIDTRVYQVFNENIEFSFSLIRSCFSSHYWVSAICKTLICIDLCIYIMAIYSSVYICMYLVFHVIYFNFIYSFWMRICQYKPNFYLLISILVSTA